MTTCTRCQGLMLEEHMIDMEASYGEMWVHGWRCFNCGHRDDAVLQHHRQRYVKPVVANAHVGIAQEPLEVLWKREVMEPLAA